MINRLLILAILAFTISFMLTPFVKKFAFHINVIDIPKGKRKIHKKPIPLLGGLAIYISFILTLIFKLGKLSNSELGIIIGATIILIGGFIDDKWDIKPLYKLLFQIAATIFLIFFGVKIKIITNPFFTYNQYINIGCFSIPLTIIWVIGITNAFNLIDGLDGLAAGVALISSITILVIALLNQRNEAAILMAILSGSILGFLPYNFNPASIFMGDTGSQLLGFLLASISIEGAIKSATAFAIAVPILALGLPIYDTLFAMIRRKINGKPIMQADKGHLHHRLLGLGLTQKQAVIIMYLVSAVLGSFAIIAMQISSQRSYFVLATVILILVIVAWKCGFFKHTD
ncbi:putative undecaprenyl-phosphate N-acetylglucosaminyl 1-phosphate transferase [Clostridium acetireducens DSM 10703]|jgi:UDP-GlcNAc:undecaprenyl-phosphate GlcNAc-1-phosphate transferase|uniref:Putative undecaprenyl-phosphate N-acetylglucosaminyl 1-phosphate transferase n=1 Tax=Clostridium acetireducens DSM 10703 TaxID=1121290 RepID=A0A1E8EYZ9_9CLOT|nr:MraY family glycosyltransferase [Clostridium acetireducens]OFI06203.1 putative undecaprenyl-phosphate N-acetylglucosaminyl 1-phosphate transferase [Clostridium acetireducens DSM 10703]